jgi:KDO2-lipid IV(A) lauroyltransferase
MYFVIYYLIGYRKNVVTANLKDSFPAKPDKEIYAITKKFYRHLCDLTMETIKMKKMNENDFSERMVFSNPELINGYFESGRSAVVLTMHYCNWEWSSWSQALLKHKILAVYKPLHNHTFDNYLNETRSKLGLTLIPNSQILRTVIAANRKKEPVITWLAADQTPPVFHTFWMKFLNREAMFYPGPAAISKRYNHPVFFQKIEKKSRGEYETTFELLIENPNVKSEAQIMKIYISKMEEVIREKPEYYLWSHKRWKHKRPENIPLQN